LGCEAVSLFAVFVQQRRRNAAGFTESYSTYRTENKEGKMRDFLH
jgi:hypothetical protein